MIQKSTVSIALDRNCTKSGAVVTEIQFFISFLISTELECPVAITHVAW